MAWEACKGSHKLSVPARAQVRVRVVSPTPVLLKDTQRPLHWFSEGNHRQLLDLHDSSELEFLPQDGKADYAVDVSVVPRQIGEPHDHKAPPMPAAPENFLQQIRQAIQQELGGMRESFLRNNTAYPGYEIDEDEPGLFEEEILEDMKKADEAEKAKEKPADTSEASDPPAEEPAKPSEKGE